MIWATKWVNRDEISSIQQLFHDQAAAFDPHHRMLLVSVDEEDRMARLWIAVPDYDLLIPYYGFEPCQRGQLPAAPILIAGNPGRFAAIFHMV